MLTNLLKSAFGSIANLLKSAISPRIFALFYNGEITDDTTYTRLGVAYAENSSGDIIEAAQDVPPYEYINGEKRFRQYEGTTKCEIDGIPNGSIDGISSPVTPTIVGEYYRIENTTGASIYPSVVGDAGNLNLHSWRITGRASSVSVRSRITTNESWQPYSTLISIVKGTGVIPDVTTARIYFEIPAGEWVEFQLPQLTETTYQLPTIVSSKDGPITVNKGTQSLLAEDIETASYYFNGSYFALADYIANICKTCAFSICVTLKLNDTTLPQTAMSNIKSSANAFGLSVVSGVISAGIYDGVSYFAKTSGTITSNEAKIVVTYDGVSDFKLYIDTALASGTSNPAIDLTVNKFSIGGRVNGDLTRTIQDGYGWDIQAYNKVLSTSEVSDYQNGDDIAGKINAYTLSEYRNDTSVKDSVGSNDATANANVSLIVSENDAFGYPVNAKAKKPWQYTTDDNVVVKKDLKDFFGGEARGILEDSGTTTISIRYEIITTTTDYFGTGLVIGDRFIASSSVTLSVSNSVREASPTTGETNIIRHTVASLATDTVLLKAQKDDFVIIWIEETTGLIKMTDSINTCVSDTAVIAGTEFTCKPVFDQDYFWIEKDDVTGTPITFVGYFPDLGNRIFGIVDPVYQTNREFSFDDRSDPFEWILKTGEWNDKGEWIDPEIWND